MIILKKTYFKYLVYFFALDGVILLTPPSIYFFYKILSPNSDVRLETQKYFETRHLLDLYSQYEWAEKHFKEFLSLETEYYNLLAGEEMILMEKQLI